jgi:hypothetical protein
MLEGRDLLFISTMDFGRIWGSREVYASRMAERNRVFFVNPHYGPEQILRRRWIRELRRKQATGIEEITPHLHVLTPPLALPGARYSRRIDAWNQDRLTAWIRKVLAPYRLDRPILWIYPPWADRLVDSFDESMALYFCIDRFSAATEGRKKRIIDDSERQLVERVDLVIAITRHLERHLAALCGQRTPLELIYNGAPIEEILKRMKCEEAIPPDISHIPAPRIGFMGSVNAKVDLALIRDVARLRPDWHWVFVGLVAVEELDPSLLADLRRLANVHLLGPRPRETLISYERHFTVSTIPLHVNQWTINIRPLKFPEYLAIGRPIISTPLPELSEYGDNVAFAVGAQQWIEAIEKALAAGGDESAGARRIRCAAAFSWESRFAMIENLIQRFEKRDNIS